MSNMLELIHITENRYSGIPTMFKELEREGMRPPEFAVRHGEFSVTFINNIFEAGVAGEQVKLKGMTQAILVFCRTPRSREELTAFTGKSRYYTLMKWVGPLVNEGRLRRTIPEKPNSAKQRFVTVENAHLNEMHN